VTPHIKGNKNKIKELAECFSHISGWLCSSNVIVFFEHNYAPEWLQISAM